MEFVPRKTRPEAGNKYYNRVENGGYMVGMIEGYPKDAGCDGLSNCVFYAAARFAEILNHGKHEYFRYAPNAEDFCDVAAKEGLEVGQNPKLGAIIVWGRGKGWDASDGCGHVAVVEEIKSDGSIITSESGYGCSAFWTTHRYRESGNWGAGSEYQFKGFVYIPFDNSPRLLKIGCKGEDVRALQNSLIAAGYLPAGQADGVFGMLTFSAVCGLQCMNGITVDGVCGTETRKFL